MLLQLRFEHMICACETNICANMPPPKNMSIKKGFRGILCPIVTPFTKEDVIDEQKLRRIVNIVIEDGAAGLAPTGGTGEVQYLLHEERVKIWEIVIDEANGRVPVLAGTGAASTKEARIFTQKAKDVGCDGVMLSHPITPAMTRVTDEQQYKYFEEIAKKVDIPIMMHNNPATIGVTMSPGVIERLSSNFDNIVSYKEDDFFYPRFAEIVRRCKDKITILTGGPEVYLAFLTLGAHGAVTAEFQACPHLIKGLKESFEKGDAKEALNYHEKIYKMINIIETYFGNASFFPARWKAIWRLRGVDMEFSVRGPNSPVTPEQLEKAAPELKKLNIGR